MNHSAWMGDELSASNDSIPTGFAELDAVLPGRGWSRSGITMIHVPREGAGELSVLLPVLAQVSQENRKIAFIAPPYLPYAPSLALAGIDLSRYMLVNVQSLESRLWAIEQALRSGACGAVVFWTQGMNKHHLRRLEIAALEGAAMGIAFDHDPMDLNDECPIGVRLAMHPNIGARVQIEIPNHMHKNSSVSLTLSIPRDNPVLCTPLPPARGRVGRIPAWRSPSHSNSKRVPVNMDQEWPLQEIVA